MADIDIEALRDQVIALVEQAIASDDGLPAILDLALLVTWEDAGDPDSDTRYMHLGPPTPIYRTLGMLDAFVSQMRSEIEEP
ncbi:MAG: hypothetical protein ACYCV4_02550 [Dermatophilaceae bacterium]